MDAQNQQQIEACVAALNRGDLTEACLRQAFAAAAPASPPRQDLLYLQSSTVGIDCQDRRNRVAPAPVHDDLGVVAFDDRGARIGRAKVDADRASHVPQFPAG